MAILDFLGISKTLKDFAGELSGLRLQIETLQRDIEDAEFAPAHPDDMLAALKIWSAANETRYQVHLKAHLERLACRAQILSDPGAVSGELAYGLFLQESGAAKMSLDVQLCGLLGSERFVELIREKLPKLGMEAPGLTLADRAAHIATLKTKQTTLRKKERELLDAAEKAGLSVS